MVVVPLLAFAAACTGSSSDHPRNSSQHSSSATSPADREQPRLYSAVTHLDRRSDGQLVACASSGGVAGPVCGGGLSVPVTAAANLPRGALSTGQILRLTGQWNGHTLRVTRVSHDVRRHVPRCLQRRLPPHWNQVRARLANDHALPILWFAPCSKDRVTVEVLALDSAVAAAIRQRYGSAVHAYGWMTALT